MKIVVSGGYGFIGANFVKLVREQFPLATILVIDKHSYAANPNFIKHIPHASLIKDINDVVEADLERANYIVNFAAESHVDNSIANADPFISSNINGTYNLLKVANKACPGARFVQVSTDEVYGSMGPTDKAVEFQCLNPTSPYAASKAAADYLVMSYHKTFGIDTIITRSSNNYGPNQHKEKFIPAVIYSILRDKPAILYGRGEEQRDWIYVEDNCRGILAAMLKGKSGSIYNLGSGQPPLKNVVVLQEVVNSVLGHTNHFAYANFIKDPRPGHDFKYHISIEKARNELLWSPNTTFQEGIQMTISWYKHRFKEDAK